MIGALRMSPRRTTANGPAKSMTKTGRQSCLGFEIISARKSPRDGASRNQPIVSGMKAASMREKKDSSPSPCEKNPTTMMIATARKSPIYKNHLFIVKSYCPNIKKKTPIPHTAIDIVIAITSMILRLLLSSYAKGSALIAGSYAVDELLCFMVA